MARCAVFARQDGKAGERTSFVSVELDVAPRNQFRVYTHRGSTQTGGHDHAPSTSGIDARFAADAASAEAVYAEVFQAVATSGKAAFARVSVKPSPMIGSPRLVAVSLRLLFYPPPWRPARWRSQRGPQAQRALAGPSLAPEVLTLVDDVYAAASRGLCDLNTPAGVVTLEQARSWAAGTLSR